MGKGQRNRALRKSALPPELRKERSERVGVLAAARNEILAAARQEFELAVQKAREEKNAKQDAAYAKFNEARAKVRADIDKRAYEVLLERERKALEKSEAAA